MKKTFSSHPILNSPYEYSSRHWGLGDGPVGDADLGGNAKEREFNRRKIAHKLHKQKTSIIKSRLEDADIWRYKAKCVKSVPMWECASAPPEARTPNLLIRRTVLPSLCRICGGIEYVR
jgi:hypothetical protein